ncbi:unnamed protein product [Effrenium voratum]|nr:unnamed protein product [Effrenium voratum]
MGCNLWSQDGVSDAGSAVSTATFLGSHVDHVYGHAAAREIPLGFAKETVQSGCRLLTRTAHGQDIVGGKAVQKPFRWMVFRQVHVKEIEERYGAAGQNQDSDSDAKLEPAWHTVIHELGTTGKKVKMVSQFFNSNIRMASDYVKEEFDKLDEDDPEIIKAVLQDANVCKILQLYFQTGDQVNPQHFHTVARLSLWSEGSLLHHCCEQNYSACVKYLLAHHSPQTAPADSPWLQLADPCWMEGTWKNSAFHAAAWNGQAEAMEELVSWAQAHGKVNEVRRLVSKKGETAMDILQSRRASMAKRRGDVTRFELAHNLLCPVFGIKPLKLTVADHRPTPHGLGDFVLIDDKDVRTPLQLPERVTLGVLAGLLATCAPDMDTVLLSRVVVQPEVADELPAAEGFLRACRCRRISFMKSQVAPQTLVALCRALHGMLQTDPGRLESILMPAWTEAQAEDSWQLAAVVWDLSVILRQKRCNLLIDGLSSSYLPYSWRYLPIVLDAGNSIRATLQRLFENSPTALKRGQQGQAELEGWCQLLETEKSFLGKNPLLALPVLLERKLLNRVGLLAASAVGHCFHENWTLCMEALVDALVTMTLDLPALARLLLKRDVSPQEQRAFMVMEHMADEALLSTFKMAKTKKRPGGVTGLLQLAWPYWLREDPDKLKRCFPKASAYLRSRLKISAGSA